MSIRAVIVSNIRLYRDGLKHVLSRDERIGMVRTEASVSGALRACAEDTPNIVLLDLTVPDALSAIHTLVERFPSTKVIALGVADAEADITACAEAGVSGYVFREGSVEDLVATVVSTSRGELQCSPRVAAALLRRVAALATDHHSEFVSRLTHREREIARLIENGLSNKEIAVRLHIEVATVKNHVHNLLEKLDVRTRGEAVARLRGRIEPTSRTPGATPSPP